MDNLKITAILENAIVTNDPEIPFDGILMLEALKAEHGQNLESVLPPPEVELIYPSHMPLEKRGTDEKWYYASSFAQYSPIGESVQYWHKRTDMQYLDMADFGRKKKIELGSGQQRNYRMPMQTYHIAEIVWYARGDMDAIGELLSSVDFIGKKRAYGNGAVTEWKLEKIGHDWTEKKEGQRTRAIPFDGEPMELLKHGSHVAFRSYRPPYWHRDNFGWCLV